jgi:hypothetical protein
MKLKVALPLMACLLVLGWWAGKEKVFEKKPPPMVHIQGQAFFVTPRGDSVKLAGINVELVPKLEFDQSLRQAIDETKDGLKLDDDMIAVARDSTVDMNKIVATSKDRDAVREALESLELHKTDLYDAEESKRDMIELVFMGATTVRTRIASAQTDGDGNFQIDSVKPSMHYYVLAYMSRTIMGQKVTMLWAIPDYMAQSPLLLSDANSYKQPPLDYLRLPKPKE